MNFAEQAERLWANLLALGSKRLALLAFIGLSVFAVTGVAGYYLSRPTNEVLYAGLDKQDVSRIGSALKEAGVNFDISPDGTSVLVSYGDTAHARMLLAEKGLPHAGGSGYELFDKMGSLGLTSFMQEITKVRAMEGELARTVQTMRGVKAARVHIVMPDEGSFRRARQSPSASVVLRTESADDAQIAQAVRHLVAAAIPGMTIDEVTVLNVDGQLLASGSEGADSGPNKMLTLEKSLTQEIQNNIRKTLAPYLSLRNFQISVAARLNTDKKETTQTIFDPESRVERSVRVIKETQSSQNTSSQTPTSAERNIPQSSGANGSGKQANEENLKKEELTNYELSSKTISTKSAGFEVENLSVAVLVNKAGVAATLGDKANPETIAARMAEIEQLVSTAAGLRKDRGDTIKVAAVEFIDSGRELEPIPSPSIVEALMRQSGAIISAAAALGVAFLLIWFGLRPATRALLELPMAGGAPALAQPGGGAVAMALRGEEPVLLADVGHAAPNLADEAVAKRVNAPQQRLEQMVEADEDQAVAILKQWIRHGERV